METPGLFLYYFHKKFVQSNIIFQTINFKIIFPISYLLVYSTYSHMVGWKRNSCGINIKICEFARKTLKKYIYLRKNETTMLFALSVHFVVDVIIIFSNIKNIMYVCIYACFQLFLVHISIFLQFVLFSRSTMLKS